MSIRVLVRVSQGIGLCQSATSVRVKLGGTSDCVVTHAISFALYSFKNLKTTLTKGFCSDGGLCRCHWTLLSRFQGFAELFGAGV